MSGVIPGLRRLINLMIQGLISFSIFIMEGAYHSYPKVHPITQESNYESVTIDPFLYRC